MIQHEELNFGLINDAPPYALKDGASYTLVTKQANLYVDKCH